MGDSKNTGPFTGRLMIWSLAVEKQMNTSLVHGGFKCLPKGFKFQLVCFQQLCGHPRKGLFQGRICRHHRNPGR